MKSKLLHTSDGQKTYALIFETGDEVMSTLKAFAQDNRLGGSHFTAIGAFRDVTLGYFDWEKKDYRRTSLDEQVEVVTLAGNIALKDGRPKVHAHIVVARENGNAVGGHLLEAHVRPTLEVVVTETPAYLQRREDPETGLALIDLGSG